MSRIERDGEGFVVEARILGEAFDLTEAEVQRRMRGGEITSRCEFGLGRDAGRWRLTFLFGSRGLRLTVDSAGNISQRIRYDGAREAGDPFECKLG